MPFRNLPNYQTVNYKYQNSGELYEKKTIIFCLIITLIFSVLSFIYYIPTFTDTTILVLGVVVMLNLFIVAELNKITQQPEKVQLWRVYFSVICSGLILVIKM